MKKDEILSEKIKTALISTFKVISLKFNKDKLEDFDTKATDLISQKNEIRRVAPLSIPKMNPMV